MLKSPLFPTAKHLMRDPSFMRSRQTQVQVQLFLQQIHTTRHNHYQLFLWTLPLKLQVWQFGNLAFTISFFSFLLWFCSQKKEKNRGHCRLKGNSSNTRLLNLKLDPDLLSLFYAAQYNNLQINMIL